MHGRNLGLLSSSADGQEVGAQGAKPTFHRVALRGPSALVYVRRRRSRAVARARAPLLNCYRYLCANEHRTPSLKRRCMQSPPCMQMTARAFCKKRDPAARLGVMLVRKGGVADEGGGDSPSNSGFLQLVRVPERERCAGAAAATCAGGRTGGTRGRHFGGLGCSGSINLVRERRLARGRA